ncbi:WhiB family transcriptional regulator [Rhodococcus pyridinivorans]|jgi:hypothetical protein|uniref:WhiB family transcriptional regulator n=1 Tax=Rhodococcus pyridinivorans TaxID=103816 RepID=UPI00110D97E5|nr:WhiB family transcriptional regulator [Rhodococcus pyridinivorans]
MTHFKMAARPPAAPDPITALVDDRLAGARCAGQWPRFDVDIAGESDKQRAERLAWARGQCSVCPVLAACRTAVTEQRRPSGVWAGRVYGEPGRPPRKKAAA